MKSTHMRLVEGTAAFSASGQLETELAKDRWDARNIPGLHYAPHTCNYHINFGGVPEIFRPLVKEYARFLLAAGRAAKTLDHMAYCLGQFFTFFSSRYPGISTLQSLSMQDVDAFIVSLKADAQTRGVKLIDRYVWERIFALEGILSYLERVQSPVKALEPTVQRLTVVDNSDTSPNGLTTLSTRPILASQGSSLCFSFSPARILMALHMFEFVFLLVVCLLFSLALLWRLEWFPLRPPSSRGGAKRSALRRLLKPRSPDDCPVCRLASPNLGPASAPVRPWREVKSRRGAPKRVNTEGFACPNRKCTYCGNTDAQIHALVGDGKHGQAERIQTFRCQACHSTFSARRDTPLYHLKTPSQQVAMVLSALAEGLDASAAERVFGYRQATITSWLTRAGRHAESLHERCFRNLHLPHLQLDELRTRLRSHTQVLWLWLAIDPRTKILPVLQLGPRTQHMAHKVIHSLRELLAPGCIPLFTSDGLNLYFYALTAHFGHWLVGRRRGRIVRQWQVAVGLIYGQVKKFYRRRRLVRVTHVMRLGTEEALKAGLQGLGFSGRLNTAFIERVNLTVRHGVAALARRTWATAQLSPHLLANLEWWRAYYHFVRPHASLRVRLMQPRERGGKRVAQRYRLRTPAMAAGRTTRRWTAREVLSYPLLPGSA